MTEQEARRILSASFPRRLCDLIAEVKIEIHPGEWLEVLEQTEHSVLGVDGQYNSQRRVIRLAEGVPESTVLHEGTHALDHALMAPVNLPGVYVSDICLSKYHAHAVKLGNITGYPAKSAREWFACGMADYLLGGDLKKDPALAYFIRRLLNHDELAIISPK